ncbi:MAG: hypothetical protein ACR2L2_15980 [Acidobacteriota bacterium]
MKPSHFATILDDAFNLPARSLTVAALLVLRRRPAAYGIRLRLCRACLCSEGPVLQGAGDQRVLGTRVNLTAHFVRYARKSLADLVW